MPTSALKNSVLIHKSFVIFETSGKCNFKTAIISSLDVVKKSTTSLQNQSKNKTKWNNSDITIGLLVLVDFLAVYSTHAIQ